MTKNDWNELKVAHSSISNALEALALWKIPEVLAISIPEPKLPTTRELFAGLAMAGNMVASPKLGTQDLVKLSVTQADALIKQLAQK